MNELLEELELLSLLVPVAAAPVLLVPAVPLPVSAMSL
jgi:hypothetical protein